MTDTCLECLERLADYCQEPWASRTRCCIRNHSSLVLRKLDVHMDRELTEERGRFRNGCSTPDTDVPPGTELTFEFRKSAGWPNKGKKCEVILLFETAPESPRAGSVPEFLVVRAVHGAQDKRMQLAVNQTCPARSDLVGVRAMSFGRGVREHLKLSNLVRISCSMANPLQGKELGSLGLQFTTSISVLEDITEFWVTLSGGQTHLEPVNLKQLQPAVGDAAALPTQQDRTGAGESTPGRGRDVEPGDRVVSLVDFARPWSMSYTLALGDEGTVVRVNGNRVNVNFPCNRGVGLNLGEVLKGDLPGDVKPGDLVRSTIRLQASGLEIGEIGTVLGAHTEAGLVRCCFPGNSKVGLAPGQFRLHAGRGILPGGFSVDETVSLIVERLSSDGRVLPRFERATVLGPAKTQAGPADGVPAGRKLLCRFSEGLEDDVPISEICGLLPGGLRPGDRVVYKGRQVLAGITEGDEGLVCGQPNPPGERGHHVQVEINKRGYNIGHHLLYKPVEQPGHGVAKQTLPPIASGAGQASEQLRPEAIMLTLFNAMGVVALGNQQTGKQLQVGDVAIALFDYLEPHLSSQSVALGDRGTAVERRADGRIVVQFPCQRRLACLAKELLSAEAELPGAVKPGDVVAATINFDWLDKGRSLRIGQTGLVLGPHPKPGHVRCRFPDNFDVGLPPEHFRLYDGKDVLPGGFTVGCDVSLVVDRLSKDGKALSRFARGTVVGSGQAAAVSDQCAGRAVRCRFSEGIEEDVPISEICGPLPGDLRPGDLVTWTGAQLAGLPEGTEGTVCGQTNPGGTRGLHVLVEIRGELRNLEHTKLRRVPPAAA